MAVVAAVDYPTIKYVWGWSVDETAGAAVEMVLRDGSATGDIQAWVNVAANASANMSYFRPLYFSNGLHIVAASGAFTMRVYR